MRRRTRAHGLGARGVHVDLADLRSVAGATEEVAEPAGRDGWGPTSALVLNAGLQLTDRHQVCQQGHELTFAVNVLTQHALLKGLSPTLADGGHAVLMGSSTHRGRRASFGLVPDPAWQPPPTMARADSAPRSGDRSRHAGGVAYATSKLALGRSHPSLHDGYVERAKSPLRSRTPTTRPRGRPCGAGARKPLQPPGMTDRQHESGYQSGCDVEWWQAESTSRMLPPQAERSPQGSAHTPQLAPGATRRTSASHGY